MRPAPRGRVVAVGATVDVDYGGGRTARFCDQIVATGLPSTAHAGSLASEPGNNPVGLLLAASDDVSVLTPIAEVQLALQVRVWP